MGRWRASADAPTKTKQVSIWSGSSPDRKECLASSRKRPCVCSHGRRRARCSRRVLPTYPKRQLRCRVCFPTGICPAHWRWRIDSPSRRRARMPGRKESFRQAMRTCSWKSTVRRRAWPAKVQPWPRFYAMPARWSWKRRRPRKVARVCGICAVDFPRHSRQPVFAN